MQAPATNPYVFTIYNHGTGGSSTKGINIGEIVNLFGNTARNTGTEFVDYMVTEGVGSKLDPTRRVAVQDPNTGRWKWEQRSEVVNLLLPGIDNALRQATGRGVENNVVNVLNVLSSLNPPPGVINMVGWSRGAVTCIRIAYWLNQFGNFIGNYRNTTINIFAVDPVAGPGHNSEPDATTVSDLVANYVAIYALDDRRSNYTPIAPPLLTFASPQTNQLILRMPGIHRDPAKADNSVGRLTFNLCARFLTHHGTLVDPAQMRRFKLNDVEALDRYIKVLEGRAISNINKTKFVDYLKGGGVRWTRDDNLPSCTGLVNYHHAALFKKLLLQTYTYIFTNRAASGINMYDAAFPAGLQGRDQMMAQLHSGTDFRDFLTQQIDATIAANGLIG